ncbi:hypothetical protein [Microcoleus sp. S13_B4]|uniref:hypothetical protein n=1 Tax=Microcoleus sp. S13_B4 TaxID=3055408 RepID=UPI002FD23064
MSQQIYYPHLYLFVYNLRNGLGQNASKIADNHKKFWEKLPPDLKVDQSAEEEYGYTENIVDLLTLHPDTKIKTHKFYAFQEAEAEFNGFYYPVRLNDTYGLLFSFSVNEQSKTTPKDISDFGKRRDFPKTEQASKFSSSNDLGKTWMLAGYLPPDFIKLEENKEKELEEKAKTIASEAYEKFTGNKWQYYENGKFLNGWIFEVWQSPHNWENLDENRHVLIIIYTSLEGLEKSAQFYEHWLRLFSYRNKVLSAYSNYQSNNEKIVKANKNSERESFYPTLPEDLEQLKKALIDNRVSSSNLV